ncbi:MAG: TonB-dependent siderophore receptor [Oceanipulchritudo sp.]
MAKYPIQKRLFPSLVATASLCLGGLMQAQESDEEGEVFWLSPFEVTTQGDTGYARTSAGTATRISMDIIDTPLSIAVISDEFIKDTGRTDLVDIFDYSSSIDTNPDDALRNSAIKVRGFGVSFVLRDGFKKYYDAPLDAIDRVEVVKGPNAVFFGQSQPGGVINYITKSPLWDPYYEARVEIGDNNHYKAWADATGPINDMFAYRIVTSYRDSESWKDYTSWENKYIFGALSVRPAKKIDIKGTYEYHDGFQEGGVGTALVGNEGYFNDYYANGGADYGYAVDWSGVRNANNAQLVNTDLEANSVGVRYPWYESLDDPPTGYVQPPDEGFGGINPRWNGTVSQQLIDAFGGSVPAAFLNWSQPDQGVFPAYQRNVTEPFQYDMLNLYSAGTGTSYRPGWRVLKWFESGMQDYPNRFTGPVFPNGYNWNANGLGAFHDTEHHVAGLEVKAELTKWLNLRYAANYLEVSYLRVQQHNSDTDMDGAVLAPAAGYGLPGASGAFGAISGASVNEFTNKRRSHQLDLTSTFEVAGTRHTFLLSAEVRKDKFLEFAHDRTPYYVENALRPERIRELPGQPPRINYAYQEGVANWDIFSDSPPELAKWIDLGSRSPGGASNYQEEKAFSFSYRGTFLSERLSVLAGVRNEEKRDFEYTGGAIGGEKEGTGVSDTTPMVGFNYELKQGLNLYASYSESFVPPSRPGRTSPVTFYEGPVDNPTKRQQEVEALGVERGVGYEGGFKASAFNGNVSGSLTVFHLERQDIIVSDAALIESLRQNYFDYGIPWDTTLDSGSTPLRKNSGTEVSEGVELDVIYRVTDNWTLTASLSYLWKAELENPDAVDFFGDVNAPIGSNAGPYPHPSLFTDEVIGTYVVPSSGQAIDILRPLTPTEINEALSAAASSGGDPVNPVTGEIMIFEPIQHVDLAQVSTLRGSLWSLYEFNEGRLEGLTLGAGGNYQSKQRPLQDRDLDYWNPGFWIFDAMARYDIPFGDDNMLSLQVNVNNLLDKRAIDSGAFGINAPRTWKFTATVKF